MSIKTALIIPDTHRPFYNRKAYNLMLEVALYLGVHEVVLLGDYCDFYSVSRFVRHPKVGTLLVEEVESVRTGLDELDRLFPQAKKVYLSGNHEARLETYLVDRAPGLFGVTECRTLFQLEQRPLWTWIEFSRGQQYQVLGSPLRAFHRPLASTPKGHIARSLVSSVYGDIHKIEESRAVGLDGQHYVAFCPGWLGDVSSRVFDYMPSVPQWQLGFALVEIDVASGSKNPSQDFYTTIVEIKNNKAIVGGKIFKG